MAKAGLWAVTDAEERKRGFKFSQLESRTPVCDSLFEIRLSSFSIFFNGEFDSGSGRTLAACLTHASRTMKPSLLGGLVANG